MSDDKKQTVGHPTVTVRRQFNKTGMNKAEGPIDEETEFLEVRQFVTPPAQVGVSLGLTINMGNYESARLDVSINVPCYQEEVEGAYTFARQFVEDRLVGEKKKIMGKKKDLF